MLRHLNPKAEQIVTRQRGRSLRRLSSTPGFRLCGGGSKAPGWLRLARPPYPETEEYGISNFIYRARRPFHPARFHELLSYEWPGVIRSKGLFWLASRPEFAGFWSQAGSVARNSCAGHFWAAIPEHRRPADEDSLKALEKSWEEPWGDRRQEIVLIGQGLDREVLEKLLDGALLTDEEFRRGPSGWAAMPDPFGKWS